jgi:hypothetical protein
MVQKVNLILSGSVRVGEQPTRQSNRSMKRILCTFECYITHLRRKFLPQGKGVLGHEAEARERNGDLERTSGPTGSVV